MRLSWFRANPGRGKSVLLQYVAWAAAKGLPPFNQPWRLPVRIILREWADWACDPKRPLPESHRSLAHYLEACHRAAGITHRQWDSWLCRGQLLVLADGLEAITSGSDFVQTLRDEVSRWTAGHNAVVLVCRTRNFDVHQGFFPRFPVFELEPFTSEQQEAFINNYPDLTPVQAASLIGELGRNSALKILAATPSSLDVICYLAARTSR